VGLLGSLRVGYNAVIETVVRGRSVRPIENVGEVTHHIIACKSISKDRILKLKLIRLRHESKIKKL